MLPVLNQRLLAQWSDLPVNRGRPRKLTFLGIRTGIHDGYAFFLAFADHDYAPCLAIKIAREPEAEARLECEWQMLNYFQAQELHLPDTSFPQPILSEVINDRHILVMTAPPGQPMNATRNAVAGNFTRVGNWLIQLAGATRSKQPLAAVRQELRSTADRLYTIFDDLSDREISIIESWIVQYLDTIGDDQADYFAVHGNLSPQNIWLRHDQTTLVNWERGKLASPPLDDLFTFIAAYRLPTFTRGSYKPHLRAFENTFLTDSPYAKLVSDTINSYCRTLGLPTEGNTARLGLYLARAALEEYEQLLTAVDRGYLPLLHGDNGRKGQSYRQAIKDQLWINLLRLLIKKHKQFKPAISIATRSPTEKAWRFTENPEKN